MSTSIIPIEQIRDRPIDALELDESMNGISKDAVLHRHGRHPSPFLGR